MKQNWASESKMRDEGGEVALWVVDIKLHSVSIDAASGIAILKHLTQLARLSMKCCSKRAAFKSLRGSRSPAKYMESPDVLRDTMDFVELSVFTLFSQLLETRECVLGAI